MKSPATAFKKLPFRHRFMFALVMSDPEICKLFLELLLGVKIDHVEFIETEKTVENSSRFHSIRLDVYLQGDAGIVYIIEMQVERVTMPLKRPRYYQSQVDRRLLAQGRPYKDLPDTYIIVLCDFDFFEAGLAVYERECRVKGTGIPYEDATHVLILNSRYNPEREQSCDPAILEVLDYVRTNEDHPVYQSELANRIVKRVEAVRLDEELEGIFMSTELYEQDLLEKGREEGREEGLERGLERGLLTALKKMINSLSLSVEQAMNVLEIPQEDQPKYRAMLG